MLNIFLMNVCMSPWALPPRTQRREREREIEQQKWFGKQREIRMCVAAVVDGERSACAVRWGTLLLFLFHLFSVKFISIRKFKIQMTNIESAMETRAEQTTKFLSMLCPIKPAIVFLLNFNVCPDWLIVCRLCATVNNDMIFFVTKWISTLRRSRHWGGVIAVIN